MSVYTTELRYICEHDAGLKESVGLNQIDDVIAACRASIFGEYPIFDEAYRPTLETMILKHYYMWEIGAETVGLFKLWLNERMNEIMPKYNLMYSALDFIKTRATPLMIPTYRQRMKAKTTPSAAPAGLSAATTARAAAAQSRRPGASQRPRPGRLKTPPTTPAPAIRLTQQII